MERIPATFTKALRGINELKERRHSVKMLWIKDAAKNSSLTSRGLKETSHALESEQKSVQ